jgi:hypothetical protein
VAKRDLYLAHNRTKPVRGHSTVKSDIAHAGNAAFSIFPSWRIYGQFPWLIWAAGWIAIFKAFLWLATDPVIPSPLAEKMAAKFIVTMIPFAVLGVGIWNLRKWAVWPLLVLSVIDLMFYIFFPAASRYIAGNSFFLLAIVLLICAGPLGNILILVSGPSMLKHAGKSGYFDKFESSGLSKGEKS